MCMYVQQTWPVLGAPGASSGWLCLEGRWKTVSTTLSKVLVLSFRERSRSVSCSSPTAGGMRLLRSSSCADGLSEGLGDSSQRITFATCNEFLAHRFAQQSLKEDKRVVEYPR